MLSIRNLDTAKQAANYFLKDDYYAGADQEQPSAWWGKGAATLGLSGRVDHAIFEAALSGHLPSGVVLVGRAGEERRPGFDLTFSAPKSVSLLALVHGADGVARAHDAAVTEALAYIEEHAAQTRTTSDRVTVHEPTRNLVVARFSHDTSRELDPQLHTHCVLINATQRADQAWRSISNERLYELKMLGGEIYRAALASGLRELGYDIDRKHADGRFEVRGFTDEQLTSFSTRREAIEEALSRMQTGGAIAAERAALMTRSAKREVDRTALALAWQERARESGISFPVPSRRRAPAQLLRLEASEAVRAAVEHLSERRAAFEERHLLAHALAEANGRARLGEIEAAIRIQVERGELIAARTAGKGGERAFVTAEAVATERALLASLKLAQGQFEPLTSPQKVQEGLRNLKLTAGQAEAVELILTTSDGIVGVQGYAGTGKTTALRQVRLLAEAAGCEVRGFAPSAAAALLLQQEAGIASQTLASHLIEQGRSCSGGASAKLWVLDESSMVSNRDALRLVQAARRAGARLVLVGDRDQLPSIEAGAAFRLLSEHGMALARMDEILRQKDPLLKKAVEHTIDRDAKGLELLSPSVTALPDAAARLDAVVREVLATPAAERGRLLVLASSNAERRALNERIRGGLRHEGVLADTEHAASILVTRDLTQAQARESAHYRVGDVVRFTRGYRQLGVAGGDCLTVEKIDVDRNTVVLRTADGEARTWQPHRVSNVEVYQSESRGLAAGDRIRWTRNDKERGRKNGQHATVVAVSGTEAVVEMGGEQQSLDLKRHRHWDHAYATTVHAAQGMTADAVILCIDTEKKQLTGHESWYVAISRARSHLRIYTDDAARLPKTVQRSMAQDTALEASARVHDRAR